MSNYIGKIVSERTKSCLRVFSYRTKRVINFDILRYVTRLKNYFSRNISPAENKLHFGCGDVKIDGWLNVDIKNSDHDIDLGHGPLPWKSNSFDVMMSQHTVEHLELNSQLIPLFRELNRVSKEGGEIWISCPDMERVCKSYVENKGEDLITERQSRFPDFNVPDRCPPQQMINLMFHQDTEHKNLFDFELLKYALEEGGFSECEKSNEEEFNRRFENVPERGDGYQTLYVKAKA